MNDKLTKIEEINEEQKAAIKKFWNAFYDEHKLPPTLVDVVDVAFPGKDPRTTEGHRVRRYLASLKLEARKKKNADRRSVQGKLTLTQDQLDYIQTNGDLMTIPELTKILFNVKYANKNSGMYAAVELAYRGFFTDTEGKALEATAGRARTEEKLKDYESPTTFIRSFKKVQLCVENHGFKNEKELSAIQKDQNTSSSRLPRKFCV